MGLSTTDKLVDQLNEAKGLSYPDIGYLMNMDPTGNGGKPTNTLWVIVNDKGGIGRAYGLADKNKRTQCSNLREAIERYTDPRWSTTLEHTGESSPQWVLRFEGSWIASFPLKCLALARKAKSIDKHRRGLGL